MESGTLDKERNMQVAAVWEIDRIVVSLDGTPMLLLENPSGYDRFAHGSVQQGQVDLRVEDAKRLALAILTAVDQYHTMERELNQYFEGPDAWPIFISGAGDKNLDTLGQNRYRAAVL